MNPQEAIDRYERVLRAFQRTRSQARAFEMVGVDRQTVVLLAPIAELARADPEAYTELLRRRPAGGKLSEFATQCQEEIEDNDQIREAVNKLKMEGKLLPVGTGKKKL